MLDVFAQPFRFPRLGSARGGGEYLINGYAPAFAVSPADGRFVDNTGAFVDFADLITYTGASTSTYQNASGQLATASSGVARTAAYRYESGVLVGPSLAIESKARTNALTYSEDFANAAYTVNNAATPAVDATGPDGLTSATTLVDDNGGGSSSVQLIRNITVSTSTRYTWSVFLKADQLSWAEMRFGGFTTPANGAVFFNLSTGAIGTTSAGLSPRVEQWGNGWWRCSVSFTTDAADTSGNLIVRPANGDNDSNVDRDGTSSILVFGMQLETGDVASSYIKTTSSTATRAAQTLTVEAADLPTYGNFVGFAFKGAVNYVDNSSLTEVEFVDWDAGSFQNIQLRLATNGANTGQAVAYQQDGGTLHDVAGASDAYSPGWNVPVSIATSHKQANLNISVDGDTTVTDTGPANELPDLSAADLILAQTFMGYIDTFAIFNTNLAAADLEAISA